MRRKIGLIRVFLLIWLFIFSATVVAGATGSDPPTKSANTMRICFNNSAGSAIQISGSVFDQEKKESFNLSLSSNDTIEILVKNPTGIEVRTLHKTLNKTDIVDVSKESAVSKASLLNEREIGFMLGLLTGFIFATFALFSFRR